MGGQDFSSGRAGYGPAVGSAPVLQHHTLALGAAIHVPRAAVHLRLAVAVSGVYPHRHVPEVLGLLACVEPRQSVGLTRRGKRPNNTRSSAGSASSFASLAALA
jgi:hypothetical protein